MKLLTTLYIFVILASPALAQLSLNENYEKKEKLINKDEFSVVIALNPDSEFTTLSVNGLKDGVYNLKFSSQNGRVIKSINKVECNTIKIVKNNFSNNIKKVLAVETKTGTIKSGSVIRR